MPRRPVLRTVGAAAFLGAVLAGCGPDAVRVDAPRLTGAAAAACAELLDALPESVADESERPVEPADAAAAWGDPPIVLRCGVPRPSGFDEAAACTTVDGVDWYIPQEQLEAGGDLVMTVVNREEHVEVVLPGEYWPPATALADLSGPVRQAWEATGRCR